MALYRALWLSVTGVLVIAGVATALVSLPWQGLLGLSLLALFVGPPLGAAIDPRNDENIVPLMYFFRTATIAVVGTIAVAGLIALSAAGALLFIALLAACSPPVLRRLLARAPWSAKTRLDTVVAAPAPPPASPVACPPLAPQPIPSCHSLSDAELCWRWRTSFTALQRTASPAQQLSLVELRSALLTELAQRNPTGFTLWLNSGARAASDPARYLAGVHSSRRFAQ